MLNTLLAQRNISVYQLSKRTGVPYTTLLDLVSGKTDIQNVSSGTLYRLSVELGVSMEELLIERATTNRFYLSNDGCMVTIQAVNKTFTYRGPKNLNGFRNIVAVRNHVIYADVYFTDDNNRIYVEEDYIDLKDVFEGNEELLSSPYEVTIGRMGESKTKYLTENSLLVSDGMAIMLGDNGTNDTVVEIYNLKRNQEKTLLRLKDYAVLSSNMKSQMQTRAIEAAKRNIVLILQESRERQHA